MLSSFINVHYCYEYLINQIPVSLLIYSHIPTALAAVIFGGYVLKKTKSLPGFTLFVVCLSFAIWCLLDLSTWFAFLGSANTMFTWSLLDLFGLIMFFFAYYFLYSFITGRDLPLWQKLISFLILLPTFISTFLGSNLALYDANACAAIENDAVTRYPYFVEAAFIIAVFSFVFIQYRKVRDKNIRREILLAGTGVGVFLLFFFSSTLLVNLLAEADSSLYVYNYEIYGLFGLPILLIYLGYLIVKYHAFDLRIFTAQALSVSMAALVATQYAFLADTASIVLNTITLILVAIVSLYLTRNVKREINLREQLAIVNEQQEGLLHFISHQIKGYLSKSQAVFAAMLEKDYGDITPQLTAVATEALRDNQEGVGTVMNILNASNMKKGTVTYDKKSLDLKEITLKQVAESEEDAKNKNLKLIAEIPNEDFRMIGDLNKLENDVIGNLIDNAIKYTPQGQVKVSLAKRNGKFLLSVKDSGVGITDEDKQRLFTAGGRGKDSVRVNVNSTGYGLYIAKQIIEAHGGKIWAESEGAGKGSTFFVELPTVSQ